MGGKDSNRAGGKEGGEWVDGWIQVWLEGGREGGTGGEKECEKGGEGKGEEARERGREERVRKRERGGGAGEKRRRTALAASRSAAPRFDRSDVVRSGPLPSEQARRMLAAPLPLSCYISPRPLVTTGRGEQMPILPALTNARPL